MADFENYMSPGRRGHLVGIGGVSMSSLAEVLFDIGLNISGSDTIESKNVDNLISLGIPVSIGHDASNITDDVEFVIRTAACHDDNPEIAAAREKGIPVFERTQAGVPFPKTTTTLSALPVPTARRRRPACARIS